MTTTHKLTKAGITTMALFAIRVANVTRNAIPDLRVSLAQAFQDLIQGDGGDDDFAEIADTLTLAQTLVYFLSDHDVVFDHKNQDDLLGRYHKAKREITGE